MTAAAAEEACRAAAAVAEDVVAVPAPGWDWDVERQRSLVAVYVDTWHLTGCRLLLYVGQLLDTGDSCLEYQQSFVKTTQHE